MARVYLDSGVFVQGIVAGWGAARAILVLGRHRVFDLETSEIVLREVLVALAVKGIATDPGSDVGRLIDSLHLHVYAAPSAEEVAAAIPRLLPLLRHRADVPVLLSATESRPDWLVSTNSAHFTAAVARETGLRIVTPALLMRVLRVREVESEPEVG